MKGNTISITGNITRDAEVKELANGNAALSFGICWNSSKKVGDEWQSVPNYFNVKCYMTSKQWAAMHDKSFAKGTKVAIVDGHLAYREWEKDGQKRSTVEIVIDDPMNGVVTASKARSGYDGNSYSQGGSNAVETPSSVYDEDIPF